MASPSEHTFITPTYPKIARADARMWRDGPAFARPLPQVELSGEAKRVVESHGIEFCKNCAGNGEVLISFCNSGPSNTPFGGKSVGLYFEGDHVNGRGWYRIDRTNKYTCPICDGSGRMRKAKAA